MPISSSHIVPRTFGELPPGSHGAACLGPEAIYPFALLAERSHPSTLLPERTGDKPPDRVRLPPRRRPDLVERGPLRPLEQDTDPRRFRPTAKSGRGLWLRGSRPVRESLAILLGSGLNRPPDPRDCNAAVFEFLHGC